MICKLSEICNFQYGYPFNSKLFNEINGTPVIRIRDVKRGYTETFTSEYVPNEYLIKEGELLVGMDGEFNIAKWQSLPAALNQRVCHLIPNDIIVEKDYLFFALPNKLKEIENRTSFATVKHLSAKVLSNIEIPLPKLDEQCKIAKKLNIVVKIVKQRQQQLEQLDLLIKSRFVEMFGDVSNEISEGIPMTKLCSIIDGDRGKNYPRQDEFFDNEYCLFLNAKNVTPNGFDFSKCQFITKEKDSCLRKGKLSLGDVVLTTRGTIGNMAYYTEQVPFPNVRINSGMVILRMNKEVVNQVFFIEQFKLKLNEIKKKIASGTAQPQLPISTMSEIKLILPNIKLQNEFAQFVEQVEETKTQVQKSLDEAQLLFNSLMQEYFG